jgi:CheY-like chemotaxis protein
MPHTIQGAKILLLDDDLLTLELFEFVLLGEKAEVRKVSSAAKALEMMESWKPDLLVSDINMPGEDGFSLIQKIREHNETRVTPVIAVTGYGSQMDQEKIRQAGYSDVLIKPVNPEQLVSMIQTVLEGRQSG